MKMNTDTIDTRKVVYPKYNITVENITVDKAKKFLEHNDNNRKFNKNHVKELVDAMKNGNFIGCNGDLIQFDKYGNLMNGQHRLRAIVESGIPQKMEIGYGYEEDVKYHINDGRPVSLTDNGKMFLNGYGVDASSFSVAKRVLGYNNVHNFDGKMNFDVMEIEKYVIDNLDDFKHISTRKKSKLCQIRNKTLVKAIEIVANQKSNGKSKAFFDMLYSCENLVKGSPAYTLSAWYKAHERYGTFGENGATMATIIALNAFMNGESLGKIRLLKDGKMLEVDFEF